MSEDFPGITDGLVGTIPRCATLRPHFVRPFQVDRSLNVYPERQNPVEPVCIASFSHARPAFIGQTATQFLKDSALDFIHLLIFTMPESHLHLTL